MSKPGSIPELERLAYKRASKRQRAFIFTGAGDQWTLHRNISALEEIRLLPRACVDVSRVDTSTTILGERHALPILLAPTGAGILVHWSGEIGVGRAAHNSSVTTILSTMSSIPIEMVAGTGCDLWFQLYPQSDRDFTDRLLDRALRAGAKAIVVSVDQPVHGLRDAWRHIKLPRWVKPPHLFGVKNPARGGIYHPRLAPDFTWQDLEHICKAVNVPVWIKGVLRPDDAICAQDHGVSGVIVSNHGGRSLDGLPSAIDVLPEIVAATSLPIIVDGGIRRGTDIIKAVALGASAVLIGRPYLYGLLVNGQKGVELAIGILKRELETSMALLGLTSVDQIDRRTLYEATVHRSG